MQAQPNEIIRIRYDSFDNLVALGYREAAASRGADGQSVPRIPGAAIRAGSTRMNGPA